MNRAPTCSGPETASGPERTRRVGTCTCSDPDPVDAVTRSLGDTDASHFELKTPTEMTGKRELALEGVHVGKLGLIR